MISLAVTREGIPVRVWCWPANTNDMSVVSEVKDDLRGWRLGRGVTVVDRGFSSDENVRYLTRAGTGAPASGARRAPTPEPRQARYQQVRDNLRVKEVLVGQGDAATRFIVCHNPAEAERDNGARDETIARLEAELDRIPAARAKANNPKAPMAPTCAPDQDRPAADRPRQDRR